MPRLFLITTIVGATTITALPAAPESHASVPQEPAPRVIEVVARRFAFEPSLIEVAVGEPVRLAIRSADGPHGLEIKKFRVKRDVPRGATPVTIDFTATEPGEFPIVCSEYCGDGHEEMKGTLVVHGVEQ